MFSHCKIIYFQTRKKQLSLKIEQLEGQISQLQKDSMGSLHKRMDEVKR